MSIALVTGANGFLAGHLCAELRNRSGTVIVGADLQLPSGESALDDFITLDIADAGSVARAVEKFRPTRIFHLAGAADEDPSRAFLVNTIGTANVLESVRGSVGEAEVLVVGSAAEYGPRPLDAPPLSEDAPCLPDSFYGVSKLASSLASQAYVRRFGMRVVVVRLFNVVGAGMRDSLLVGALARRACEAIKAGSGTLRIGNLLARRDFLSATDAAKGCVAALDAGRSGEIYNLCSGTGVTVESVARSLVAATGHDLELVVDPSLDRGADASVGSPRKARDDFGFAAPIPLGRAIAEAWEFVRAGDTVCASAR